MSYDPDNKLVRNRVERLRSSVLGVLEKRSAGERPKMPHKLFWSLFFGEVSEIQKQKQIRREERDRYIAGEE